MVLVQIIDDAQFMKFMLKKLVDKTGYEVLTTRELDDALNDFKEGNPNVVIYDLVSEEESNLSALRKIVEHNNTLDTKSKIICITTVGKDNLMEEAKNLGVSMFIGKPYDDTGVIDFIKEVGGGVISSEPSPQKETETVVNN
tara:strand:- start:6204 stop:6629 length:426 start_codon:yes stop_codon:yes gene_type:complete